MLHDLAIQTIDCGGEMKTSDVMMARMLKI